MYVESIILFQKDPLGSTLIFPGIKTIEKAITQKTKVIIPVHLNGHMANMQVIMDIAKKHNLFVVEDSAQALGATQNSKKAGSFGDTSCFSFYPAKLLGAFCDAGVLCTNNEVIYEKVKLLRNHGQKTKTEIVMPGFTSRLDNLQAAILNVKFKYVPGWIKRRREIADIYNNGLGNIKGIKIPNYFDNNRYDVFQNYVLRAENRDKLFDFLKGKEVECLIKDATPNHLQKVEGMPCFSLPFTEQLSKEVISLPMYPELDDGQIQYIINCIKEFYGN